MIRCTFMKYRYGSSVNERLEGQDSKKPGKVQFGDNYGYPDSHRWYVKKGVDSRTLKKAGVFVSTKFFQLEGWELDFYFISELSREKTAQIEHSTALLNDDPGRRKPEGRVPWTTQQILTLGSKYAYVSDTEVLVSVVTCLSLPIEPKPYCKTNTTAVLKTSALYSSVF